MKTYEVNISGDITVEIRAKTEQEAKRLARDVMRADFEMNPEKHISKADIDTLSAMSNWIVENVKEVEE